MSSEQWVVPIYYSLPGNVVWVCGVDDMYVTLAGSRMKPLAPSSVLHNLGFSDEMVWRS